MPLKLKCLITNCNLCLNSADGASASKWICPKWCVSAGTEWFCAMVWFFFFDFFYLNWDQGLASKLSWDMNYNTEKLIAAKQIWILCKVWSPWLFSPLNPLQHIYKRWLDRSLNVRVLRINTSKFCSIWNIRSRCTLALNRMSGFN